jgi:hypothetical protein
MNNLLIWEVAPTKSEIDMYAQNICNELNEGFTKPEDLAVKMAAIETFAKTLRAKVEEHIIDFLGKCPKGTYNHLGAELKLKDSQTYDYASYSERWAELQSQIDILKDEQKEIEENGKNFERGIIPLKSYKQTYSITLNK